ncbi:MAG: cytochrome c [Gammaproteobacteria bacterium]|nr:cytochrome c [Gammaproteobacteria bacterium]
MKNKKTLGAALLVSGILFSGASIAGGASAEALSVTCAGCHGYNGASTGPATPSLAGMSAVYLEDSMKAYKAGEREATIMTRIAKGYDDDDFAKMGQFFASKKMHTAEQSSGNSAKKGKKIHKKYCSKCHEDAGTSADDDSGQLAGQWSTYLKYSLEDVMEGTRDTGKKMKKKVKKAHKKYGDEMVPALLDYYASQD